MKQKSFQSHNFRIVAIEKQLNLACSQHDELMPLLEVEQHILNFNKWISANKYIATHIASLEQLLSHPLFQSQQVEVLAEPRFQKSNHSIHQWQAKIQNLQRLAQSELVNLRHFRSQSSTEIKFKEIRGLLQSKENQFQQSIHKMMAQLKTQLELLEKRQSLPRKICSNQLFNRKLELVEENVAEQIFQFQSLSKNISLINSMLPQRPFQKFYRFTCHRIEFDICQINKIFEFLLGEHKQNLQKCGFPFFKIKMLEKEIESVKYQLQGLKKECLREIMKKYHNDDSKFQAHSMELVITNQLQKLEKLLSQVSENIHSFLENAESNQKYKPIGTHQDAEETQIQMKIGDNTSI